MQAVVWSAWRPLPLAAAVPAATLREQLDGGQSFRWDVDGDGVWTGVFGRTLAGLRLGRSGLEWRGVAGAAATETALRHYLDGEGAQARLVADLPWRSDAVLRAAIAVHPGLRILRQDPHEALIGFLCSSNKRILQIRQMVLRLATSLGDPLGGGHHALPSWRQLAEATDAQLKACALGYRAAFLRGTARRLQGRPKWAEEFAALSTADLLAELQALPGVGPKVAACVALFGFGRLESFPVDTWVVQALAGAYGFHGWAPARLEEFGRVHFGPAAGLAQQYLFAAARAGVLPMPFAVDPPAAKPSARPKSRARRRR
jgi:N-glycosylase/DNA lyase